MFMGTYGHSIDAKGRVIVPAKFREVLGDSFVVTLGLDGCLFVYPEEEWEDFVKQLKELPGRRRPVSYRDTSWQELHPAMWTSKGGY